jgi:hypothetical protein
MVHPGDPGRVASTSVGTIEAASDYLIAFTPPLFARQAPQDDNICRPRARLFCRKICRIARWNSLERLRDLINQSSATLRREKQDELESINQTDDELTEKQMMTPCTELRKPDGSHEFQGCEHCFYKRTRRRLDIKVHEDFLPLERLNEIHQRSIVFELKVPRGFAAYREATWEIVNRLCPGLSTPTQSKAELLLSDYSQL